MGRFNVRKNLRALSVACLFMGMGFTMPCQAAYSDSYYDSQDEWVQLYSYFDLDEIDEDYQGIFNQLNLMIGAVETSDPVETDEIPDLDGIYDLENYPYTSQKSVSKAIEKAKKAQETDFVYVEPEAHILSESKWKQSAKKTEYITAGTIKKGYLDGTAVIFQYSGDGGFHAYIPAFVGNFKKGLMDKYGCKFRGNAFGNSNDGWQGIILVPEYEGEYKKSKYNGKGTSYNLPVVSNKQRDLFLDYIKGIKEQDYIEAPDGRKIWWNCPIMKGEVSYQGQYKKDNRNGKGVQYEYGYLLYEGGFKNNQYSGKGTLYFSESDIKQYVGQFKNGQFNGKGTLYTESGEVKHKGKFKKGLYE